MVQTAMDVRQVLFYRPAELITQDEFYVGLSDYGTMAIKNVPLKTEYHVWESVYRSASESLSALDGSYSLYIVSVYANDSCPHKSTSTLEEFWNDKSKPLLFTTFAHISDSAKDVDLTMGLITRKLKSHRNSKFEFACYISVDCCDIVIFFKSTMYRPVVSALDELLSITNYNGKHDQLLQNCYTISGLWAPLLQDTSNMQWVETFKKNEIDISLSSRSFTALRANKEIIERQLINALEEPSGEQLMIRTTLGNQDAVFSLDDGIEEISAKQLVDFQKWVLNVGDSKQIANAITGLTIRISVLCGTDSPNVPFHNANAGKWTETIAEHFLSYYDAWYDRAKKYGWAIPLRSLLSTMKQISRDCIYDDVFFQCTEPIWLFLRQLRQYVDSDGACFEMKAAQRIHRFLRNLHQALVHASRRNGELAQFPDNSLMLFDLPSKLSLFYQAFLYRVINFFNMNLAEESMKREIVFFTVPKQCYRNRGQIIFPCPSLSDRLLLWDIPAHMLFDPKTLMVAQVQQLVHFCTMKARNYNFRCDCFIYILSSNLLSQLELYDPRHDGALNKVAKKINKNLKLDRYSDANPYHLEKMSNDVLDQVLDIFGDEDSFGELVGAYCNDDETMYGLQYKKAYHKYTSLMKYQNEIESLTKVLVYLFHECYADIVTICTLELSLSDYLKTIIKADPMHDRMLNDERGYCKIWERLAIVSAVFQRCQKSRHNWNWDSVPDATHLDDKKVKDFVRILQNKSDKFFINYFVRRGLTEYLTKCLSDFQVTAPIMRKEIKNTFKGLTDSSNSPASIYKAFTETVNIYKDYLHYLPGLDIDVGDAHGKTNQKPRCDQGAREPREWSPRRGEK